MTASVILCSHNPNPDRLSRCLEGLRRQSLPLDNWELICVDNCSAPAIEESFDFGWHPRARIVIETQLGLTPARLRGIAEAKSDLLVFVDDDNILREDYLETALSISHSRPYLGAWGGSCEPEFEVTPESWTERYWCCLAIREVTVDRWSNEPRNLGTLPIGAGMCVRRQVGLHYAKIIQEGLRPIQLDRAGELLLSAGDQDLAACGTQLGYGSGVLCGLHLKHIIPPSRLRESYLCKLMEGIAFSGTVLDAVYGVFPPRKRSLLGRARELVNIFRAGHRHRRILIATLRGRDRGAEFVHANWPSRPFKSN